jgi:2-dehydro-3-deoxyphosphogluconate aldolase/(4S)-4-hydroxy-2-oxoglutarate aldolase
MSTDGKKSLVDIFEKEKIVAIIRTDSPSDAIKCAHQAYSAGIRIIEFTMTIPDCLSCLKEMSSLKDGIFGMGTVLDAADAKKAVAAGAEFIVSPNLDRDVVLACKKMNITVIPGVATPTEIMNAYKLGAEIVKIFPASNLGGPEYIKNLKGPYPFLKTLITGGVDSETFGQYLKAGASCAGFGSLVFKSDFIKQGRFDLIKEEAEKLVLLRNRLTA